jgi:hypothetical protein
MESFMREANFRSPLFSLNAETGVLEISGNSGAYAIEEFDPSPYHWIEALDWFAKYLKTPGIKTTFNCKLECFNTITLKYLLEIFRGLESLKEPFAVELFWFVGEGDADMLDIIDDFNHILGNIKIQVVKL